MQHCDYFDYWGSGTEVTVSSDAPAPSHPTLFPLVKCGPEDAHITVGCLAYDFFPKSLTFQWTDASGTTLTSNQYPPSLRNNKYTGVSLLQVSKIDWASKKSFKCLVNHLSHTENVTLVKKGPPRLTLVEVPSGDDQSLVCTIDDLFTTELTVKWKKNGIDVTSFTNWPPQKNGDTYSAVSVLKVKNTDWDSKAVYTCEVMHQQTAYTMTNSKVITIKLNQASPKEMFNNNQAKLECIITAPDADTLNKIRITWQIDGSDVTNNISERNVATSKISTLICSHSDLKSINNVRCSAISDDMAPVFQDLTIPKGDGSVPKITVHVLPEEDITERNPAEVTLVCLVSSTEKTDYYIAWMEQTGGNSGSFTDGVNFPPQKTKQGFSVTSIYTTTKEKWEAHSIFTCNVWHVGSKRQTSRDVSVAVHNSTTYFNPESKLHFALSCTDESIDEDEYSSLWSTTSSFIFLFISSLIYSMIFSLVKMKGP